MVFPEALQRDKAMEEEAGKMLRVQQWVKDCYPPKLPSWRAAQGWGNAAFPMTSSDKGRKGGKRRLGFPG